MSETDGTGAGFDIEVDYCVIGAGSAGCVLAARLSEVPENKVVLVEAGPPDRHPLVHVPAGYFHLQDKPQLNWSYRSDPSGHPLGRQIRYSAGKMLGGSSSLNGIIFARGQKAEFESLSQAAGPEWSYDAMLPYFKKSESFERGGDEERGGCGPVPSRFFRTLSALTRDFVRAANQAGYRTLPDLNRRRGDGVGLFQQNCRGRLRISSASAYLKPAGRRRNLAVMTSALCRRVLLDGTRAIGVEIWKKGACRTIRARKGIVLSCGVFRSPHLLQLSGIGDARHLTSLGIRPVADLSGVGRGLRDQYLVRIQHRVAGTATINQSARGPRLVVELLKYGFANRGVLTLGASQAAIFARSGPAATFPDVQMMFAPVLLAKSAGLERQAGMTIGVWVSNPDSIGSVMARSPDPSVDPVIHPGYFSDDRDWPRLRSAIGLARAVFAAPALAQWSLGEVAPGASITADEQLRRFALERGESGAQLCATCRMGQGDDAVVDDRLRVRGLSGLRVVDASVLPMPLSGGLHANVVAVAEKAAAMILDEARGRA